MSHEEMYKNFKKHFSCYIGQIEKWFPNDENSIRIHFKSGREYIYTITHEGFRFEAKEHLIEKLKGEQKM